MLLPGCTKDLLQHAPVACCAGCFGSAPGESGVPHGAVLSGKGGCNGDATLGQRLKLWFKQRLSRCWIGLCWEACCGCRSVCCGTCRALCKPHSSFLSAASIVRAHALAAHARECARVSDALRGRHYDDSLNYFHIATHFAKPSCLGHAWHPHMALPSI
jgi:hypothetical protein